MGSGRHLGLSPHFLKTLKYNYISKKQKRKNEKYFYIDDTICH